MKANEKLIKLEELTRKPINKMTDKEFMQLLRLIRIGKK